MFSRALLLLWCLLCAGAGAAHASQAWWGVVTRVSDGDTLWVRPAGAGAPRKIRLHGIDAPELCQAHGPQARAALQGLVLQRSVRVQSLHSDDYGRLLARLWLEEQDVGAVMVREGHAWSYRYRNSPGPYAVQEREARAARRGLFAQADARRPYEFRRRHGPCVAPVSGWRTPGNGAGAASAAWSIRSAAHRTSAAGPPVPVPRR